MRSIVGRRPSPAFVVACVALVVALSGTGYAALSVPRNSVGTAQLRTGAVTSLKVRNHSLKRIDFKSGALLRGPRGFRGPAGPTGPAGSGGAVTLVAHSTSVSVPAAAAGQFVTRVAETSCASGEKGIAGGTNWSNDTDNKALTTVYSRPVGSGGTVTGWRARGGNGTTAAATFSVVVLCAKT